MAYMKDDGMVTKGLRVADSLWDAVRREANKNGRTVSGEARILLQEAVEARGTVKELDAGYVCR